MARPTARALLLLGLSTPAFAQDGTLNVTSTVLGAQVYIDNTLRGQAPLTAPLAPGSHTVRVLADGFEPFVRRVSIDADASASLDASLSPGAGTVEFVSSAPSASVTLSSGQTHPLPVRLTPQELSFGSYGYTISAPTFASVEGSFDFRSGQNVFVFEELESNAGRVAIRSTPEGADIFLDGARIGVTPLSLEDHPPGVYAVRLEQDDHALVFRTLDTTDGDIGIIEARLPERGATLVFRTGADDAEVRIEGQAIGSGSRVVIDEIERRQYDVEVLAEGQKPVSTRLDVPASGRHIYKVEFEPTDARTASQLVGVQPLTRRWTFWTATGVGAAAAVVGGALLYSALQPEPVPNGDVVVTIP